MKKYPSIFNDVLSPITPGPSSSNTCGPCRIARTALRIFGGRPGRVLIEMCDHGGYPDTFYGMQSDRAFLAGLMDRDPIKYDLSLVYDDARALGIQAEYRFVPDLPAIPSELCRMTFFPMDDANPETAKIVSGASAASETAAPMRITAASLGGGSILISDIDGCPVQLRGDCHELLLFLRHAPDDADVLISLQSGEPWTKIEALLGCVNDVSLAEGPDYSILNIKCWEAPGVEAALVKTLVETLPGLNARLLCTRRTEPVYPITSDRRRVPPFTAPAEMLAYIKERNIPLWQAAVDYEAGLSGWSQAAIFEYAEMLYDTAQNAMEKGLAGGFRFEGVTGPNAPRIAEGFSTGRLIPMGIGAMGGPAALGIMEYSNARGTIVCMPTGGSSGIIPGAIFSAVSDMGLSREDGIKALLCAGLIGIFMYETNYTGAIGCQAEVGCATAMAAAALCTFLTDDAEKACAAASLAIQNGLGLVCDPIAGYVQVPCLIRNMTAVPTAAMCANAAACGFPATVPLEEMAESILRVGEAMRPCNSMGTCATATGKRLEQEIIKKRGR